MIKIDWEPSIKQFRAFEILRDKHTTEMLYGGGAGGGKSYLGCAWLIINCIEFPGSRWLMARAVLKTLKQTTLLTFFDICKGWGFRRDIDYKYNPSDGVITWSNGSEIYLKDLKQYPTDPEFDCLGSTEYTGVYIDEGSEVSTKAKNIVMTRIRYKLIEFNLIPKLLITSNPYKNFLYREFYKPYKEKKLLKYRCFLPSLVTDNPYISPFYIQNLKKTDKITQERLLKGNWEYDDDPTKLFEYDDLIDMLSIIPKKSDEKYISCDPARLGPDKTVIMLWEGLFLKKIFIYPKTRNDVTRGYLEKLGEKEDVRRSKTVVDEDGIGGGIVDEMRGIKGFVNNARPIKPNKPPRREKIDREERFTTNYANLKSQCYFKLAEYIKKGKIGISKDIPEHIIDMLIEELEVMKQVDPDKDAPLRVIGKDDIKELLGRSPDLADAMMERMFFEVQIKKKLAYAFV